MVGCYRSVEDVDLFPAGLAEQAVPGALLGPTFSCILAQQFSSLKKGDRFWFENRGQPKPFSQGATWNLAIIEHL